MIQITACHSHDVRQEAERLQIYRCLAKPVEIAEIRQAVRDALQSIENRNRP